MTFADDSTMDTNKLYALQKSFDYRYYQYTRPNRTNSFKKKKNEIYACN